MFNDIILKYISKILYPPCFIKIALKSFMHSFIFSLPIYFCLLNYEFGLSLPYIVSILVIVSVYTFICIPTTERYFFGFFVGLVWFYWAGLSFNYTPFPIFGVIAVFFICICIMLIFIPILFFENKIYRGICLLLISYVALFNFEWFVPDAMLAFSIFKVDKFSFLIIILATILISYKNTKFYFISCLLLIFTIDFDTNNKSLPDINIYPSSTYIPQDTKWTSYNLDNIVDINIGIINKAIKNEYHAVLLPETAFPLALNDKKYSNLLELLITLSKDITIITGAYRLESNHFYNSTYVFSDQKVNIMDKATLAPFGEYIPLPYFLVDIYRTFFNVNYKLVKGKINVAQDFYIKDILFRSAICYEGGVESTYLGSPSYMTLISNNTWFKPSIEPVLQMILIKYYARKYNTIIFHSSNGSKAGIILPYNNLNFYTKSKFL